MRTNKEPVRIRQRKISGGQISLYLDIYYAGTRTYEFLKLYLVPETSKKDKDKNRETMRLAEAIKAKRIVEIQNDKFGFDNKVERISFTQFFYDLCMEKTRGTAKTWHSAYNHLVVFSKGKDVMMSDVTADWVNSFSKYLSSATNIQSVSGLKLKQSTKKLYFDKLCAGIRLACKKNLIKNNPLADIDKISGEDIERIYLTPDELKKMVSADYPESPNGTKRAFLFSCLTGLRKSDISKLKWGMITETNGFLRITFRQNKTDGLEYLDLSPQVRSLIGERGNDNDLVFNDFVYNTWTSAYLRDWAKSVGINKKLTFHSGRHTFALLCLNNDTDIYTVSRLLGHRSVSTTMRYAHILDQKKQQAVSSLPDIGITKIAPILTNGSETNTK